MNGTRNGDAEGEARRPPLAGENRKTKNQKGRRMDGGGDRCGRHESGRSARSMVVNVGGRTHLLPRDRDFPLSSSPGVRLASTTKRMSTGGTHPASAVHADWIPACAGMTVKVEGFCRTGGSGSGCRSLRSTERTTRAENRASRERTCRRETRRRSR